MVKLVATIIGCEAEIVERVIRLAPDDRTFATTEFDAYFSADKALCTLDISGEILVQGTVPLTIVDQAGVLVGNDFFEAQLFATQRKPFQRFVGDMEHICRWSLIDLARFDANEPVLNVINAPDAVVARKLVQRLNEHIPFHLFTVQSERNTILKGDLQVGWFFGVACVGIAGPGIDLFGWLGPGIFQDATFDAASPQVLVGRVRAGICGLYRNIMFGGIGDLVVTRHAPLAHGCDDFEIRGQRVDGDIEAYLFVAFARTAMRYGYCTLRTRNFDQQSSDQWTCQRRCQWIDTLVDCASLKCGPYKVTREVSTTIHN